MKTLGQRELSFEEKYDAVRRWKSKLSLLGDTIEIERDDESIDLISYDSTSERIVLHDYIDKIFYFALYGCDNRLKELVLPQGLKLAPVGLIRVYLDWLNIPPLIKKIGISSIRLRGVNNVELQGYGKTLGLGAIEGEKGNNTNIKVINSHNITAIDDLGVEYANIDGEFDLSNAKLSNRSITNSNINILKLGYHTELKAGDIVRCNIQELRLGCNDSLDAKITQLSIKKNICISGDTPTLSDEAIYILRNNKVEKITIYIGDKLVCELKHKDLSGRAKRN